MWQLFTAIMIYMIKIAFYVLIGSFRLAWKLLKWEGRAIRVSFRKYPIGFISFFLHFIGFWMTIACAEGLHSEFLFRIYTMGLCSNMDEYAKITLMPMELLMFSNTESNIMVFIGVFVVLLFAVPVFILVIEAMVFLFPILYAILTQLILGIPFRAFVMRWREKHDSPIWEEEYDVYENTQDREIDRKTYESANVVTQRNSNISVDESSGLVSVTFREDRGPKYREFDESYNNVKKRIDDRTQQLFQIHEQLIKKKGTNKSLERMFEETMTMHNEMHFMYKRAYNTVCYTNDHEAMQKCYAELKKEMIRVRNAQANLTDEFKKVYGGL